MTFGLTVDGGKFEWGAKDLNAIFGQRRNLFRPAFYKLLRQVLRFNKSVLKPKRSTLPNMTLGEVARALGLGEAFQRSYILPDGRCHLELCAPADARIPGALLYPVL